MSRFVTNLYYGALQRDPTAAELQDKINQLAAAGVVSQAQLLTTASQIARSLFTSTNYETSPYRSDIQYVTDLYYAYLQRGPDDSGLNWWAVTVLPGSNRANVCNAFEGSGEFQTLVATLYGTSTSDNQRTENFVNNFYLGAYGMNATSTQLEQQRDALNTAAAQGQSQVQAQAETMGRALFAGQVNDASLSNTQYVTNLYEAFLQRGPDAGGLGFWAGQASVGQGRQNVLDQFATCGPFRELAGTLYREANWLVADQLGTPRMVVNKAGSLSGVKRHDYLPFGEDLFAGTGGRTTTPQGYISDTVRQKFTQYERDYETGLDYSQARYYANAQGRFTGVDPLMASAKPLQPQSWNRYVYCLNNPLKYVDPSGLEFVYKWNDDLNRYQFKWVTGKDLEFARADGWTDVVYDENGRFQYRAPAYGGRVYELRRNGVSGWADELANYDAHNPEAIGNLSVIAMVTGLFTNEETFEFVLSTTPMFGSIEYGTARATGGLAPVLKGQAGVDKAIAQVEMEGATQITREVTLDTGTLRTRPDFSFRTAQGDLMFGEAKNGPSAFLRSNQKKAFALIESQGAIPRGAKAVKAGLSPGVPIGPTPVRLFFFNF